MIAFSALAEITHESVAFCASRARMKHTGLVNRGRESDAESGRCQKDLKVHGSGMLYKE